MMEAVEIPFLGFSDDSTNHQSTRPDKRKCVEVDAEPSESSSFCAEVKRRRLCEEMLPAEEMRHGLISTNCKTAPEMHLEEQKRREINKGDSAGTLRTPKATSSAARRLEMCGKKGSSKSTQREELRIQDQIVAKVWIIGSSYIRQGEQAAHHLFGKHFGLNAKVKWFGEDGMRWDDIVPRFYAELSSKSPPDVLVIHAGGNDLGLTSPLELSSVMIEQLMELHADFPAMKIAFSVINERQTWQHGNRSKIDRNRKLVNSSIRKAVGAFEGVIIEHPQVKYYDSMLFVSDGVHFTQRGYAVFLKSIHSAIKRILQNSA